MGEFTLPEFEAKQSKDFPEFLIVFCPREDCPGSQEDRPFLVHKRTWMRPQYLTVISRQVPQKIKIVGRCCPYCHKVSRLPRRIAK